MKILETLDKKKHSKKRKVFFTGIKIDVCEVQVGCDVRQIGYGMICCTVYRVAEVMGLNRLKYCLDTHMVYVIHSGPTHPLSRDGASRYYRNDFHN
jgi:hypothetical protein